MLCSYLIYFSPSYHMNGTNWYMLISSHCAWICTCVFYVNNHHPGHPRTSMHSKHCVWSECVCMANVIVKRYLPYHISRAAKLWCVPLMSPGFFLEMKVIIFNRRGTHTQTPFITEIHIIYYFNTFFSTVHLHCWWLTQSLVRTGGGYQCFWIDVLSNCFLLLFAGGGVYLS